MLGKQCSSQEVYSRLELGQLAISEPICKIQRRFRRESERRARHRGDFWGHLQQGRAWALPQTGWKEGREGGGKIGSSTVVRRVLRRGARFGFVQPQAAQSQRPVGVVQQKVQC